MGNVGAAEAAGVCDSEGRRDSLAAADLEVTIVKASVGEAMTEGVERLIPSFGESAIADLGALVVPDGDGSAFIESIRGRPRCAQALELWAWSLG